MTFERNAPGSLDADAAFAAIHALALRSPLRQPPSGVERLLDDGLVSRAEDGFRLTDRGHRSHRALCERERQTLDLTGLGLTFVPIPQLARRLRRLSRDWEAWPGELERRRVVRDLCAVVDETAPILLRSTAVVPRFSTYLPRLQAARTRVGSGQLSYAFDADIDSIGGVWHELHEDYLQTLGIAYDEREATP